MKLDEVAIDPTAAPGAAAPKKDLVITGRTVEISREPQTDAEGQLLRQRFHTKVDAGAGRSNNGEMGRLPGVIEYTAQVGDAANGARTCCGACSHWDSATWLKMIKHADTSPLASAEDKQTIAQVRTRLIQAFGVEQSEEALMQFGVCKVLSEIVHGWVKKDPLHWPVATKQDANCPEYVAAGANAKGVLNRAEITTQAAPFGLFKAKDGDAIKIGDARRDSMLFDAAGKTR